jgi:hypothetical protein
LKEARAEVLEPRSNRRQFFSILQTNRETPDAKTMPSSD